MGGANINKEKSFQVHYVGRMVRINGNEDLGYLCLNI